MKGLGGGLLPTRKSSCGRMRKSKFADLALENVERAACDVVTNRRGLRTIQFLRTTQFASRYSVVQPAVASRAAVGDLVGKYAQ